MGGAEENDKHEGEVEKESDSDTDEDVEYEKENIKNTQSKPSTSHHLAAVWILLFTL